MSILFSILLEPLGMPRGAWRWGYPCGSAGGTWGLAMVGLCQDIFGSRWGFPGVFPAPSRNVKPQMALCWIFLTVGTAACEGMMCSTCEKPWVVLPVETGLPDHSHRRAFHGFINYVLLSNPPPYLARARYPRWMADLPG